MLTGADYRALGVARSLGRRGIPVWLINQGGHLVAAPSRYVQRRVLWPADNDLSKIAFLIELSSRHHLREWLLIPTDDWAVALVARHHESLRNHFRLTVPPWEELQWACDKRLLHQLAERLGISAPWTICAGDLRHISETSLPYPVILKPALRTHTNSLAIPKAWRADDCSDLLTRFEEAGRLIGSENLIVQELIPGEGHTQFSYAALCQEGNVFARIVARRTRQYPKDFGQFSTFVESVEEPGIADSAERLLAATKFTGLAEVEFKRDLRSGTFKLLDVNPRVWGWHTLARRAGVDFPYLLWRVAHGLRVSPSFGKAGVRWMYFTADLPVAAAEILRGRLSLQNYLNAIRGAVEPAVFAWDDPLPALLDTPLVVWAMAKRIRRASRR